jgi:subtilisin family serine protease
MARFVLANRKAGVFRQSAKETARSSASYALSKFDKAKVIFNLEPNDPWERRISVFEADPREIAYRRSNLPADVIIEPEIFYWQQVAPPRDLFGPPGGGSVPSLGAATSAFRIGVTTAGRPAPSVLTMLYLRGPGGSQQDIPARTDQAGIASFNVTSGYTPAAVLVLPANYWSMLSRSPTNGVAIDCPPLPSGPSAWWHDKMKIDVTAADRGTGVTVGHIDTGCGPHPNLGSVRRIGAFVGSRQFGASYADDVDDEGHGTHTAGIIAAAPQSKSEFAGFAPNCTLCSIRVFASANSGATNADIASAIDYLAETEKVDLINLSLGGSTPSEVVRDSIDAALEQGTLCICAAGNSSGEVNYPAAFQSAVAVSALGLGGWGPSGSLAASRVPSSRDRFGGANLYLADFSCYGSALTTAAPGVGLISTVPDPVGGSSYAAMDGTSMSTPAVCGTLAAILASDSAYLALPRDLTRAHAARVALNRHLSSIGLAPIYEGGGLLTY